jgi:hypothetical protein
MTYARLRIMGEAATDSDYANIVAKLSLSTCDFTSPTVYSHQIIPVGTAVETVDLGAFAAIQSIVLVNKSTTATETIYASWTTLLGERPAGGVPAPVAITDVAPCTLTVVDGLLAHGALAGDVMVISAAEDAANNNTYMLQYATDATLTVREI